LGRLLPQIAYYVSAYRDMVRSGAAAPGDRIHVCVPAGNFGNILAAYAAKAMGVPIGKLLCASNSNNVLTDFIQTGVYDSNRPFYTTASPAMDILVSSNVERLLFWLSGGDGDWVRGSMERLAQTGRYELTEDGKQAMREQFVAGWYDDAAGQRAIAEVYEESAKLIDPHTAIGLCLCKEYRGKTGDAVPVLTAGTASPFKFPEAVLSALNRDRRDPMAAIEELSAFTGQPPPAPLRGLFERPVRFDRVVEQNGMLAEVLKFVAIDIPINS
jgi:threonine synthase